MQSFLGVIHTASEDQNLEDQAQTVSSRICVRRDIARLRD